MKNQYVEFDRLMRAWDAEQEKPLSRGQRDMLVEIARREEGGLQTKITDLVHQIRLGTGPTIQTNLTRLCSAGLVKRVTSPDDARAVRLSLTAAGHDYLNALASLMLAAIK